VVNLFAEDEMTFYFYAAVAGYAWHGWRRDTDNQFRNPAPGMHGFMIGLMVAEIGAWLV